jgi:hypothetical protein
LDEKPVGTGFLLSPNCRITLPQMSRQPGVVCEDKFLLYKLHLGEDFDFFPLLTPLIETMKEGLIPSFNTVKVTF